MAKEKSLVEEAIIQMKNLEETVAENAKGILASTMKEEIKELVKESLNEQNDEEEIDTEMDVDMDVDMDMEEPEMEDDMDMEDDMEMDMDNMDTIDLTGKSDEEVLKVFELMGPEDQIMVSKDSNGNIHFKDDESGKEYMIVGESDEELYGDSGLEEEDDMMFSDEMMEDDTMEFKDEESIEDIMQKVFGDDTNESIYETEMDFDMEMEEPGMDFDMEMEEPGMDFDMEMEDDMEMVYEVEMDEEEEDEESEEEVVYEIEMDEEEEDESYEEEDESYLEEAKKTFKAKGQGMGNPSKFKYNKNPNQGEGFKVVKKNANKTMGTGSAKKGFSYDKNGENLDGEFKIKPKGVKKAETKEAARTYGNGSKSGRGLRKGITPNRNLTFESVDNNELQLLREKNEEYRKALNVFRNKLNEVAVFNSNLAYATRLFTEHSTSKQEKINILRRFDGVETIKESKSLYKTIKEELSGSSSQPMNESFSNKIEKAPSTGSAINLIESKTYENPQFLRMKDLMAKLK